MINSSLSDLNKETFTLINQIPVAQGNNAKVKWIKHTIKNCGKKDGIYDKSSGQMFYKANTFTAYITNWQNYKKPDFVDGYYSLSDEEKQVFFTANIGDLIIFADIPDEVPKSLQEFNALFAKYKDMGGTINGCEAYISFKPDGTPWKTNHIEVIKS